MMDGVTMRGWCGVRRRAVAAVLGTMLCIGVVRPAHAEEFAKDFGVGVGTVFVDLVYMPAKVVYATLGGLTGGLAFLLTGGRMDTATAIWRPALGGTYVVTPSMLRGEDPIYFSGGGEEESDNRDRRPAEEPLREGDGGRRGESY